jgi:Fur family ferric uptake transcriptional regulator
MSNVITAESMLDQLRQQGQRVTTARRLVISTLIDARGHVTAEDLAVDIQEQHPEIHLSTVYRTLDSLEKLGIVEHTHVGHGPAVYHVGITHQHLVCEECGAVIDVPTHLLEGVGDSLRQQYGFELHIGHFALLGRCASHTQMRDVRI